MGPPGIEPITAIEHSLHTEGQDRLKASQIQGLALESGADAGKPGTAAEPPKTITGYITDSTTDSDLKAVVEAWPNLSQEARRMIAGIVEAEKKG